MTGVKNTYCRNCRETKVHRTVGDMYSCMSCGTFVTIPEPAIVTDEQNARAVRNGSLENEMIGHLGGGG